MDAKVTQMDVPLTAVAGVILLIILLRFAVQSGDKNDEKTQKTATTTTATKTITTTSTNKKADKKVELILDADCANIVEWMQHDTTEKSFLAFGDSLSPKSTLEEVKNLPFTSSYKDRFSEDPESEFYFRRGKITSVKRFTAVIADDSNTDSNLSASEENNNQTEFGHIENVFINSPHLYVKDEATNDSGSSNKKINSNNNSRNNNNKMNSIVGWVYNVYIAPNHRGKGLSKHLVKASIDHFLDHGVKNIYLKVVKSNMPAYKTYKKCGFEVIDEVESDNDIDYLMKYRLQ